MSGRADSLQRIARAIAAAGPWRLIHIAHFIYDHPAHRIVSAVRVLRFFQRDPVAVVGELAAVRPEEAQSGIRDAVKRLERGKLGRVGRGIEIHRQDVFIRGKRGVGREAQVHTAVEPPSAVGVEQIDWRSRWVVQFDEFVERVVVGAADVRRVIEQFADANVEGRRGIRRIARARSERVPKRPPVGIASERPVVFLAFEADAIDHSILSCSWQIRKEHLFSRLVQAEADVSRIVEAGHFVEREPAVSGNHVRRRDLPFGEACAVVAKIPACAERDIRSRRVIELNPVIGIELRGEVGMRDNFV